MAATSINSFSHWSTAVRRSAFIGKHAPRRGMIHPDATLGRHLFHIVQNPSVFVDALKAGAPCACGTMPKLMTLFG